MKIFTEISKDTLLPLFSLFNYVKDSHDMKMLIEIAAFEKFQIHKYDVLVKKKKKYLFKTEMNRYLSVKKK